MPDHGDEYGRVTAQHYDASYAGLRNASGDAACAELRNASGDAAFYLELARTCGGPVLALGCGTSRVLLPIARAGIDCTGLDPSPAMLDALRAGRPERVFVVRVQGAGDGIASIRSRPSPRLRIP
jgi:SAM-dependent methyltransferase